MTDAKIFYEEIVGQPKEETYGFEQLKLNAMDAIRKAKADRCHGTQFFELSRDVRNWLEDGGFTVTQEDEIFYKCDNDDPFNICRCFNCRNAGEKTGETVWMVKWPKLKKNNSLKTN